MAYKPKPHQQPSWSIKGATQAGIPAELSRWEKFLIEENLDETNLKKNPKVFAFVKEHADKFYVPTKVLKMYGVVVDV